MWRRLRRSEKGQALASWLIACLIRWIAKTIRWEVMIPIETSKTLESGRPIILIFWHNRILMMPAGWSASRPITLLRSAHRDGLLIGRAIEKLGYQTVTGSTNRDGARGLRKLIHAIRDGRSIGITPDGPRGPRMRLSRGTVTTARLSQAVVIPVAWNVEQRRTLKTWDQMILARPFSRGGFFFGEPILVPKKLTRKEQENYRLLIEEKLNLVSLNSDLKFCHNPIEPSDQKILHPDIDHR